MFRKPVLEDFIDLIAEILFSFQTKKLLPILYEFFPIPTLAL